MPLLTLMIFLPVVGALVLYLLPWPRSWRCMAVGMSGVVLALGIVLAVQFDWGSGGMQFEGRLPWIPALGASYHVAIDGLSLPLVLLSALLSLLGLLYSWPEERHSRAFFALFLLMETGLIGVFSAFDLLLFYVFFEVSLVPMYFIIGVWGHKRRVEAALKFFLYTRVGSLAMLLSILALYLAVEPRTFDLPAIIAAQPYAGAGLAPSLVLLGFFVAFAIKLPLFPFHTWLPDAHTEAPTAGSVLLAGVLLKLGGYGFLRLALPTVPDAFSAWAVPIAALAVTSAIYGAMVAMAQPDIKRLLAFSSVNHMGYVMLGVAVAATGWAGPADRLVAASGATYQLVAHGLVTGGLFFLVGMLAERTGTRAFEHLSGLWVPLPLYGSILAFTVFASFGLPGLAHFAAEVQIVLASLGVYRWAAVAMLFAVLVTTAMFLWTLQRVLFGQPPTAWARLPRLTGRELATILPLIVLIILLGVLPGPLVGLIEATLRTGALTVLARGG